MPASAFGTGQWVWQRNEKWLLLMHFWSCTVSLLAPLLSLYWPCLAGSASLSAVSTVRCPCLSASRSVSLVSQCEHETNQNWKATVYNFFLGSAAREPKYRCQSRLEGRVRKNSFVKEEGKSGEWGLKNSNRGRERGDRTVKTREEQQEGSMLRLKYRHRMFLVWLILRGLVRCQLVMTSTYLFSGCTVDDTVFAISGTP